MSAFWIYNSGWPYGRRNIRMATISIYVKSIYKSLDSFSFSCTLAQCLIVCLNRTCELFQMIRRESDEGRNRKTFLFKLLTKWSRVKVLVSIFRSYTKFLESSISYKSRSFDVGCHWLRENEEKSIKSVSI